MRMILMILVFFIIATGCTTNSKQNETITRENEQMNPAVHRFFQEETNIIKWQMLEDENRVLFAIRMKQFPRFKRNTFEKKWTKALEEFYPNKEVTLSSDFKIRYEMNKFITNEMTDDSNQAREKKLTTLINLLKEET